MQITCSFLHAACVCSTLWPNIRRVLFSLSLSLHFPLYVPRNQAWYPQQYPRHMQNTQNLQCRVFVLYWQFKFVPHFAHAHVTSSESRYKLDWLSLGWQIYVCTQELVQMSKSNPFGRWFLCFSYKQVLCVYYIFQYTDMYVHMYARDAYNYRKNFGIVVWLRFAWNFFWTLPRHPWARLSSFFSPEINFFSPITA
jgi:hypothetical protein